MAASSLRPEWWNRVSNVNKSFGDPPPLPSKQSHKAKPVVDCNRPVSMDAPIRRLSLQKRRPTRSARAITHGGHKHETKEKEKLFDHGTPGRLWRSVYEACHDAGVPLTPIPDVAATAEVSRHTWAENSSGNCLFQRWQEDDPPPPPKKRCSTPPTESLSPSKKLQVPQSNKPEGIVLKTLESSWHSLSPVAAAVRDLAQDDENVRLNGPSRQPTFFFREPVEVEHSPLQQQLLGDRTFDEEEEDDDDGAKEVGPPASTTSSEYSDSFEE